MEEPPRRLRLPDDVLTGVLARLAPRSLAVSRCVCRDWRAVVDDRCRHLLRPDLLPLTVGGIFVESYGRPGRVTPAFFARPSVARRVAGRLESIVPLDDGGGGCFGDDHIDIDDCCNGLLLLSDPHDIAVVNPATRRSARLPPCDGLPEGHDVGPYWTYLAFDPTVSPHYEVISMQHLYNFDGDESNKRLQGLQWPPPVYVMRAYSSRTGRWEERRFALDDDEGLQNHTRITDGATTYDHSAYWRGVRYVHCNSHFILRITLSDDKYQVIDLPTDASACDEYESYLGKSKNGIYFAAIIDYTCPVTVWFLDESHGKVQWVFKHSINQYDLITHFLGKPDAQTDRPWILQDSDSHQEFKLGPAVEEVEKNLDWDSDDNESTMEIKDYCDANDTYYWSMIFGFHPYKEIVFLHSSSRVVAYHFSRSKVQDLGELCFKYPGHMGTAAFIYTPCWVGDLSEK